MHYMEVMYYMERFVVLYGSEPEIFENTSFLRQTMVQMDAYITIDQMSNICLVSLKLV